MNKILVIIVTYNAMQWVERCFDSLRKSTVKPDVFVVDNGSMDGTQAYMQMHYPEVMFQQSETNMGFGKANNLGLQYALDNGYEYVYLLNQDAWVMPDTFNSLVALSKENPEYGILSPFQMNADMYHIDRNFVENVLLFGSNSDICNDMYNNRYNEIYPAKNVMAAHWFMTRECLIKIGGFSPSFPHYAEDYNYLDRVQYRGMKTGIIPKLRVVHDRGWREDTTERKFLLMYTGFIKTLSSPSLSTIKGFASISYNALIGAFVYKSLKPIRNWIKVLCNINTILKNRKISMNADCAFLIKRD